MQKYHNTVCSIRPQRGGTGGLNQNNQNLLVSLLTGTKWPSVALAEGYKTPISSQCTWGQLSPFNNHITLLLSRWDCGQLHSVWFVPWWWVWEGLGESLLRSSQGGSVPQLPSYQAQCRFLGYHLSAIHLLTHWLFAECHLWSFDRHTHITRHHILLLLMHFPLSRFLILNQSRLKGKKSNILENKVFYVVILHEQSPNFMRIKL